MKESSCLHSKSFSALLIFILLQFHAVGGQKDFISLNFDIPGPKGAVEFEIHGRQENIAYMRRVESILTNHAGPLIVYFDYEPTTPIHFNVVGEPTRANGSALVFPRNQVNLHTFPPIGNSHLITGGDWVKNLVLHELTHILHLDQTRGFFSFMRSIFGSFGKVFPLGPTVVPRWFTEGIATWAETFFTDSGRMRQQELLWELRARLIDPNFCPTIDCLSEPGESPYGQFPYWIGGAFLDFLEKKKPGTVSCLVYRNSNNMGPFLTNAFKTCVGRDIYNSFKWFRETAIKKIKKTQKSFRKDIFVKKFLKPLGIHGKGYMSLQADYQVVDGKFYYLQYEDRIPYFKILDFDSKKLFRLRSPAKVSTIHPGMSNPGRKETDTTSVLVSLHQHYSRTNLREVRELVLEKDGAHLYYAQDEKRPEVMIEGQSYRWGDEYLSHPDGVFYFLFQKDRWKIVKDKVLFEFPPMVEISKLRFVTHYGFESLTAKVFDPKAKNPHQIWSFRYKDTVLERPMVVWAQKKPFQYLNHCGGAHLVRSMGGKMALVANKKGRGVVTPLTIKWINKLVAVRWDDEDSILFFKDDPNRAYYWDAGCKEVLAAAQRQISRPKVLGRIDNSIAEEEDEKAEVADDSYPSLSHFIPRYWMLNYMSGDALSHYSASTNLADPLGTHNLGVNIKHYPSQRDTIVDGSYTYDFGRYYGSIYRSKYFVSTAIKSGADVNERVGAVFGRDPIELGIFDLSLDLGFAKVDRTDFISTRKYDEVRAHSLVKYKSDFHDELIREVDWDFAYYNQKQSVGNVVGIETRLKSSLVVVPRFLLHGQFSFGSLNQNNFGGGAIFGGGYNDFTHFSYHEFYGISYSDAFGLEMLTYRVQGDFELARAHRGPGMWPVFLKTLNLLGGYDYIETDRIFVEDDGRFIFDGSIDSWHIGSRMKGTLFYYVPVTLDILYNELINPGGSEKGQTLIVAKTQITF